MGIIKCEKCGKTFDYDKYYGLCPKCGRYNKQNNGSSCEINGDLSYEHLMEHKETDYSSDNTYNNSDNMSYRQMREQGIQAQNNTNINNMSYKEMREQGMQAQEENNKKVISLFIKIFIGFTFLPLFINIIMGVIAAIFMFVS